jgi:hypothetical protein
MDVGLHLRERDPERFGDLLVAHLLEVKKHERNPLMFRQPAHRVLERRRAPLVCER